MTITVEDLQFYAAERMTDNADGGGQMSSAAIVSGASNQIFDDISDVDRAVGDASIRKVYAAVISANTDKYLDAGVVIFREPADPSTSVVAFSTGSYYDECAALKTRIEQTISRGARWNGWLWGQHLTGQRVAVLWQRPAEALPSSGQRLELVAKAGTVEQYSQFLWITRITESLRTRYDDSGAYQVREVVCELAEPLNAAFTGPEPTRADPMVSTQQSLMYDTRYNAEAVPMFGIRPLAADAAVGDFTVQVDQLYSPLIPTAFTETALPDVNPGGDSAVLIAGKAGTITFSATAQVIKPNVSLYLGMGALPGTVSIAVSGATLTDDNGVMRLGGVTDIGTIDYGNGVIRWNSVVTNYGTASKAITFTPAARPLRVADSAAQIVTAENRGFVWVLTLTPVPAPQTLRVSYRVNNVWYVLSDQGGGQLRGVDSSYGSGNLNFTTGTVTLTTGALPDVGSPIIYTWGTPVSYTPRGGDPVDAPVVRGQAAQTALVPGTVSVSWTVGATTYTLDDSPDGDGTLTGTGGVGFMRYATGAWWVRPAVLPPLNTEFTLAYDHGVSPIIEETFPSPTRETNGHLILQVNQTPIRPGTLEATWDVFTASPVYSGGGHVVEAQDDKAGTLVISEGISGAVSYAAGTIDFLPDITLTVPTVGFITGVIGYDSNGPVYRQIYTSKTFTGQPGFLLLSGTVTVRYQAATTDIAATETVTLTALNLDLTRGYGETISRSSVRFTIGSDVFVETAGQIYRNPSVDTGAGTLAGTLDFSTGRVYLNQWTGGIANAITLESLTTEVGGQPVDEVVFRAPVSPLKPGTLQLRYTLLEGAVKSKTVDSAGHLEDADVTIDVDYPLGVIRARFGVWKIDSALTPEEKLEDWYNPDHRIDFAGVLKIWKPQWVMADSILYNAVAQTFLPPDSTLLGLNAARLPPDGQVLIYVTGRLVLIHHTASLAQANLSPTQVIDCGRVRLYRVVIEDSAGQRLPASFYTVNRELGIVTMAADLDLTGYAGPYALQHTVADLARIVETDINGQISLNQAVSHAYPATESRVSGVLFIGTMQARYTSLFAQSAWTSVYSDTLIGSAPLAQYNDTAFPIMVSNLGAYKDRILVKFTSSTAFQVFGENLGLIATGDITQHCAPVNPLTGQPYFTLDYRGWGSGWATGNCVRFNLIGANYPVDLIRAIQPSSPTGLDDSVELLLIGNTDA